MASGETDAPQRDAGATKPGGDRTARLKAALRANLARRKGQARDLGAAPAAPGGTGGEERP